MKLNCWNCGKDVSDEPLPLSRHASCGACGEFLHCCRLCTQYAPGRSGDCDNELSDPPTDKTSANFCEFFSPDANALNTKDNADDAKAKLDALFGDDPDDAIEPKSNPLDDLFND